MSGGFALASLSNTTPKGDRFVSYLTITAVTSRVVLAILIDSAGPEFPLSMV